MPDVDKHAPGTFAWLELATTDQAGAKQFYSQLFGWTANDFPTGPGEVYTVFQVDGKSAAAARSLEAAARGIPPHWQLYVAVENADSVAARAAELGGTLID